MWTEYLPWTTLGLTVLLAVLLLYRHLLETRTLDTWKAINTKLQALNTQLAGERKFWDELRGEIEKSIDNDRSQAIAPRRHLTRLRRDFSFQYPAGQQPESSSPVFASPIIEIRIGGGLEKTTIRTISPGLSAYCAHPENTPNSAKGVESDPRIVEIGELVSVSF